jgi:hypothetical protein
MTTMRDYSGVELGHFMIGYMTAALWSSYNDMDGDPEPLDENYEPLDIDADTMLDMASDCDDFLRYNTVEIEVYISQHNRRASMNSELRLDALEYAGHDFWLTRNGHGAGFWDRGYGECGERLSEAARVYGESDLYVGDDGKIYA